MSRQFIATLRSMFDAEDALEARLIANELQEVLAEKLDEGDTVDVTQVIPIETANDHVEPSEVVEQLYRTRDLLIKTRIVQCYDLATWVDQTAWILEHRQEDTFDITGYDHGRVMDRANILLGRAT